jgi:peptide deformylase
MCQNSLQHHNGGPVSMAQPQLTRSEDSENSFQYLSPQSNLLYATRGNPVNSSCFQVFIEPNDDQFLRTLSEPILNTSDPTLKTFAQEYLLPTMYQENGIGIASIQCGIPLRIFIVDIPNVVSINQRPLEKNNPRYVREALAMGKKLKVIEKRPKYLNGECHMTIESKVVGTRAPQANENEEKEEIDEIVVIERHPIFVLNPQIEFMSTETVVIAEGCLSVPAEYVAANYGSDTSVMRPLSIDLRYTTLDGQDESLRVDGTLGEHEKWLSRCIQHEYDHLDGVLYTDKLFHAELRTEVAEG